MIRMKLIWTVLFCTFIIQSNFSQSYTFIDDIGSVYDDQNYLTPLNGSHTVKDNDNNIIIVGNYMRSIFDSGSFHPLFELNTSADNYHITKIDSQGDLLWQTTYSANDIGLFNQNLFNQIHSIEIDNENNLYVAGEFENDLSIHDVDLIGEPDVVNFYLAKFDADGNLLFIKSGISPLTGEYLDIFCSNEGRIFTSLKFKHSVEIDSEIYYARDTINFSTRESLLFEINPDNGEILNHALFSSGSGNGYIEIYGVAEKSNGNLFLVGRSAWKIIVDGENYGSGDFDMFFGEISKDFEIQASTLGYGVVNDGSLFGISEVLINQNDQVSFTGFFRGNSFELAEAVIPGIEDELVSFIAVLDLQSNSTFLLPYYSRDEIKLALNNSNLLVTSCLSDTTVIGDTTINYDRFNPLDENLLVIEIDLDNLSEPLFSFLGSANEAVGIELLNEEIFIAMDYNEIYEYNTSTITTLSTNMPDVFIGFLGSGTLMNLSVSENDLIKLYPNPATEHIYLNTKTNGYQLYSSTGELLVNSDQMVHDISLIDLTSGVYMVRLLVRGKTETIKFYIQR